MTISKVEWESLKQRYGNKCILCGYPDKNGNTLEKAHLKAKSKGGTQYVPMCPNCHSIYDKGGATKDDLDKLGISREQYRKMIPKSGTTKKAPSKESNLNSTAKSDRALLEALEKQQKKNRKDDENFFRRFM